jgi:hypothetical protein
MTIRESSIRSARAGLAPLYFVPPVSVKHSTNVIAQSFTHMLIIGRKSMFPRFPCPPPKTIKYDLAGNEQYDLIKPY